MHEFTYRMMMLGLDLDEVKDGKPFGLFFSDKNWRPYRYERKDLHRPEIEDLKAAVVETMSQKSNIAENEISRVTVVTQPRTLGHCFNPVSFYYAYREGESDPCAVMAEINNTPWDERFCYVIEVSTDHQPAEFKKDFHVSPFMPMEQNYRWSFSSPSETVQVAMENHDPKEGHLFDAGMLLHREDLSSTGLLKTLFLFPFNTVKTLAAIYWHALRLRVKGAVYFDHPSTSEVSHA